MRNSSHRNPALLLSGASSCHALNAHGRSGSRMRWSGRKGRRTADGSRSAPLAGRGSLVRLEAQSLPIRRRSLAWESLAHHDPLSRTVSETDRRHPSGIACERGLEQQWLREHEAEFAGDWVALDGARLLGHGKSAREVLNAARSVGVKCPLVVHIPPQPETEFGGW